MTDQPSNIFDAIAQHTGFETDRKANPTQTSPGSNDKLYELIRRAELGQDLWHEEDLNCLAQPGELSRGELDVQPGVRRKQQHIDKA